MPKGTKVHRCVQKVKKKHGKVSAIKICQKSTGQAYMTGKPPKKRQRRGKR